MAKNNGQGVIYKTNPFDMLIRETHPLVHAPLFNVDLSYLHMLHARSLKRVIIKITSLVHKTYS